MRLPAELCKMQRKKRETDEFSKSTLMTPPGSHPTSGFGARHGLPNFFRHKKRRIVQNDAAKTKVSPVDIPTGWDPRTKQQRRVALADFSAAPWRGFEKSERGPNNSSLFQPLAAVVVVAVQVLLSAVTAKGKLPCKTKKTVDSLPPGRHSYGLGTAAESGGQGLTGCVC